MYAIIEQGSKQYRVSEGDLVDIDLADVASEAEKLTLEKVLLVSDGKDVKIGTPYVEGAGVVASFQPTAAESIVKGEKLYPTHLRRRKNSRRRIGHRQRYMRVLIEKING